MIKQNAGGMNDQTGFPVFFTEVSERLGRYDDYEGAAKSIAAQFPPAQYPAVLDICCGIGKMSYAMSRCGYDVVGVDLSQAQLRIAEVHSPGPEYVQSDMGSLPGGAYDLLLNVYTSFGYYSTEAEDLAVLPEWYKALRPGGVLIMELADMDRARNRIDDAGRLIRLSRGVTEYLSMDWEQRLLKVDYAKDRESWSCLTRLYEKEDLQQALLQAGFASVELYGSFDCQPKKIDDNLVIVARKGM